MSFDIQNIENIFIGILILGASFFYPKKKMLEKNKISEKQLTGILIFSRIVGVWFLLRGLAQGINAYRTKSFFDQKGTGQAPQLFKPLDPPSLSFQPVGKPWSSIYRNHQVHLVNQIKLVICWVLRIILILPQKILGVAQVEKINVSNSTTF